MITYLIKESYANASYARPARVRAFIDYLSREVPRSRVVTTDVGGSSGSVGRSLGAIGRLASSLWIVGSSGNRWTVIDYPNCPASVPRRMSVYLAASAYVHALRALCTLRGVGLVVQSDDDPAMQDEWLGKPLAPRELYWERRFERQLFRSADRLWFTGEVAAELLCERYGVQQTPTYIVPNGATPASLPRPDDGLFRFVYAGALHADTHGVANLIEAIRRVDDPCVRLLLMGPDGGWLESYLTEHPESRVEYLGCLSAEEAQATMTACDVGVLTGEPDGYHSTGCPGKLGSYLAAGLPIVSTARGDCARIIERNGNGVLCDWTNMSEVLAGLAADRVRYGALRARTDALKRAYSWDSIFGRAVGSLPVRGGVALSNGSGVTLSPADDASSEVGGGMTV